MNIRALSFFIFTIVTCVPTYAQNLCLFNPSTGRQQECLHVTAGGQCAHFGAPCN